MDIFSTEFHLTQLSFYEAKYHQKTKIDDLLILCKIKIENFDFSKPKPYFL